MDAIKTLIRNIRNVFASEAPVIYKKSRPVKVQDHKGGKHYMGSHAPVCSTCFTTVSHGKCLNRLCQLYLRKVKLLPARGRDSRNPACAV